MRPGLRELGLDERKLLPAYPRETWERVVELVSSLVEGASREERHWRLGEQLTRGFSQTTLGRVLTPAVRLIGVSRLMQRAPRHFELTNNFTKARVVSLTPGLAELELNHASPSPELLCGSLAEMARYAGAKAVEASFTVSADGKLLLRVAHR